MTLTVIDGNNMAQVIADAGTNELEPKVDLRERDATGKFITPADPKEKVEAKVEDDKDDVEGDDGLTPKQKREMSAAMLKTVGKKHRMMREAEEFAASTLKERQALERENADLKAKLAPPPKEMPRRDEFTSEAEFIESLSDWKAEEKVAAKEMARQAQEVQNSVNDKYERALELVPDFKEVTASSDALIPTAIKDAMRESDKFAELWYHFAKTPTALDKLTKIGSVNKQLVELGKIEAILPAFGSTKNLKDVAQSDVDDSPESSSLDTGFSPSKARRDAPVIKPLNSSEGQQMDPDPRDMSIRETIQAYSKANKANLQLRRRH